MEELLGYVIVLGVGLYVLGVNPVALITTVASAALDVAAGLMRKT